MTRTDDRPAAWHPARLMALALLAFCALLPVAHELASVTVLHPSCALADGYATALMVLGPERGRAVAERLGLRVIWITQEQAWPGDGSRDRMAE